MWASQDGCAPGQGSTPGEHRVPARSAARVSPSPAVFPGCDTEPWLVTISGQLGHCSRRRYLLLKGLQTPWQQSTPEDSDRKISNVGHQTCRSVAWPDHTGTEADGKPPSASSKWDGCPCCPTHRAKPVQRGVATHGTSTTCRVGM